jgi:hypothetical protein
MTTRKSTSVKTSTKKQASTRKATGVKAKITPDDIRRRAAEIYHQRMQHGFKGDELSDWLQAEKELNGTR